MGIRIRQAPSGKAIEGTADGQILVWNDTTKEWDIGTIPTPPAAGSFGQYLQFNLSDLSFMAPGTQRSTDPISVPMGGRFVAGKTLLIQGAWQISFETAAVTYAAQGFIEASIDNGSTWSTVAEGIYRCGALPGQDVAVYEVPVIGGLSFSVAPQGDVILFRFTFNNDGGSGGGIIPQQTVVPVANIELVTNFQ